MNLSFGKKTNGQSKIAHPQNAYLPALRAWDDVNHFAVSRMKRSDMYAAVFAVLAILGWGGMVYYANQPKLIPYVIHTDKLDQQMAVVRAEQLSHINVDPAVVRANVRSFIFNVRSVTFDPVFQKNMIHNGVKPFIDSGSQADSQIATFYGQNDPFKRAEKNSVEVTVNSPVPMSPTTYQVDWIEHERDLKGQDLATTHWRGFITVAIKTAGDEPTIIANPAGVYITNIQWSQVQG